MRKWKKEDWYKGFMTVISYSFILLFLYAASSKLMDYDKFVVQIGQSAMLSAYAGSLAWVVPAAEIVIAVLLAFETLRLCGLLASFSIMVMFTTYIYIVLQFTDRPPCSCGGILEKLGWVEHLVFNGVFVMLAVIGVVLQKRLSAKPG